MSIGRSTRIGVEKYWFIFAMNNSNVGVVYVDHGASFPLLDLIGCLPNRLMCNSITVTEVRKYLFPNANALSIWTQFRPRE